MSAEPPNDNPLDNQMDDELTQLWQAQKLEGEKMSLEQIRDKAWKFERSIRRRNRIEYIAAGIVFLSFGVQVFYPDPANFATRIGAGLTVLATVFAAYTLHTRGSAKRIPDAIARASFIEFYRSSLESQRDLLRNVWRWYILPFVPGLVMMMVSFAIRDGVLLNPAPTPERVRNAFFLLLGASAIVGLLFVMAALNKRSVRKLQSEIDALEHQ